MKCPNCGEEMADGALYCEHCGEDIHIVPDFEPELDENLQQIISGIVEEIAPEDTEGEDNTEDLGRTDGSGSSRKHLWFIPAILALLVLAAAVGMGIWVYLYNSEDYQTNKAVQCVAQAQYDEAIAHYNRALELNEDNIELRFSLAEVYYLKNNKIEYEYQLRVIARSDNATVEQLDRAYGRLIAIYRDRGDYQTINELLRGSENQQMISTYQNYIANPPEFSVIEGYYTSIQPLKLTAAGNGKIYYTLDGSDPDENSTQYTMPIILEAGDYVVKALFVNDYGIVSEIARKEYHIEKNPIPEPEVSVDSGTYNMPMNIEVLNLLEEDEIYYTTDGTIPTASSRAYTGAIHMPLGHSHYMFARIVDGVTGDVAERNYDLVLNTEYKPEQALEAVRDYSLSIGRIYDGEGHFDESGAIYVYEFLYAERIKNESDFYVIAEVRREADGAQTRTGSFYAVNVYDGTGYRLLQDERGRSTLEPFAPKSEES